MAQIVGVCRSQCRADPKENVGSGRLRTRHGLVGDAHAGLSDREISLLALESIEQANSAHGISAGPGDFAENLTTQGIDLLSLQVGDLLRVGPALLEVVQLGKPPSAAHTYNFRGVSILPTKGVFCRVLEGGPVAIGDELNVTVRKVGRDLLLRPIGYVVSDFARSAPPEQMRSHESRIVVDEAFAPALEGLQAGSRLTVVFHFHLSHGFELLQHPRGDRSRDRRGVFTLCSPRRPNPIGVSFVDLIRREGRLLVVRGLDALNQTPVLDIKPFFVPEF